MDRIVRFRLLARPGLGHTVVRVDRRPCYPLALQAPGLDSGIDHVLVLDAFLRTEKLPEKGRLVGFVLPAAIGFKRRADFRIAPRCLGGRQKRLLARTWLTGSRQCRLTEQRGHCLTLWRRIKWRWAAKLRLRQGGADRHAERRARDYLEFIRCRALGSQHFERIADRVAAREREQRDCRDPGPYWSLQQHSD